MPVKEDNYEIILCVLNPVEKISRVTQKKMREG